MITSETLLTIMVITLGGSSLLALLAVIRQKLPHLFAHEARRLHRVLKTQDAHRLATASQIEQGPSPRLITTIQGTQRKRQPSRGLTLVRKLRYAQWRLTPSTFHLLSAGISSIVLVALVPYTNTFIHALSIASGPMIMSGLLTRAIERRANAFDADYPQFLLSVVGLLKTGLTPITALETAAKALKEHSLVRQEVLKMVERIRVGVLEDASIGVFGETILHPEIELFVQVLLLNNRLGGTLSDSLERLSKQVRKRQYFKSSAVSAVALQRGSLVVILVILVSLQAYLAFLCPHLVLDGMRTPVGWQVWQGCGAAVITSFVWVRKVTRIKV